MTILATNVTVFSDNSAEAFERDIWGSVLIFLVIAMVVTSVSIILMSRRRRAVGEVIVQVSSSGLQNISTELKWMTLRSCLDFDLKQRASLGLRWSIASKYLSENMIDRVVDLKLIPEVKVQSHHQIIPQLSRGFMIVPKATSMSTTIRDTAQVTVSEEDTTTGPQLIAKQPRDTSSRF